MTPSESTVPGLNIIVLAAGYGTRLGPMGLDHPKGLLELGGETVLDRALSGLQELPDPRDLYVVTNARFSPAFLKWAERADIGLRATPRVLNDGTSQVEDRLGAVGDLALALKQCGLERDCLILVTDSIFEFSLSEFVGASEEHPETDALLAVQEEPDPGTLRSRGVVTVSPEGRIERFQEKPSAPTSSWTALPIYFLRARSLPLVDEYLRAGGEADAPGFLMEWLVNRANVGAWKAPGSRLDVGTPEGYARALERFRE